jgi:amino acid adenylation domain-containing protein/non-ribosomal peptide synthase protein (TIGR01720 family)
MENIPIQTATLTPEDKRALLAKLLLKKASQPKTAPLSFAQQRLWFIDELEPGGVAYNIYSSVRLFGHLNKPALARSLQEIVHRHEALRTTFSTVDGVPVQLIASQLEFHLEVTNLQELEEGERTERAEQLAREDAELPFDLSRGPLLRARLLTMAADEHVLLFTMHHIISDGWSMGVLVEELAQLYESYSKGEESTLPELSIQYADYTAWQRGWFKGDVLEEHLGYWRKQLEGAAVLELPTDHPRPPVQTFRGRRVAVSLSPTLFDSLKKLCEREEVTLFMMLLAAFKVLLYRYSGQSDIVVAIPSANRTRPEIEKLIGFFINTLVLRTQVSGNLTFRELLFRVRDVSLEAYAYQEMPFERLVEELHPERDLSRTPIIQVMFNLLKFPNQRINLRDITVEVMPPPDPGAKMDLTLYARDQDDELELEIVYNADLFEEATINWMLTHLQTLLEGIVADPAEYVARLPLLAGADKEQLALATNTVRPDNPFVTFPAEEIEQSLADRFVKSARLFPQRTALKTKHGELSYEALSNQAERLAQTIIKVRGSGEERIALLFEHGAPMIVALLGALQAGKTYVPLDAAYPLQRIVYMLEDSQAGAIITNDKNEAFAAKLAKGVLPVINIDRQEPSAPLDHHLEISPDLPAYILYTSGSTGQPKGVAQSHRNVLYHSRNYTNNLHISAEDRLSLLASYSFDAAVMDTFGALLNGASLHLISLKEEGFDNLAADLISNEITIYHSTPTVFRYFMNTLSGAESFPHLRLVVMGGEAVFKRDVDLYKKHFAPHCIFINGLGPTESTVTLQYFLNHQTELTRNNVPVGFAVEGAEVLLINDAGEKVEGCGIGEMVFRSAHVALGYWQKPELTRLAFLPDPESSNKRFYRSGDIGRLLPDGTIEFVGRKDFQVKIRGQRVEVGEIETILLQNSAVKEAVVIARADYLEQQRLIAYVVLTSPNALTNKELRNYLKERLPDYMVPAAFVQLESLPLLPNGKVNRRALPEPAEEHVEREKVFGEPVSPAQELIAGIWSEVLGVTPVGIRDNFFDIGGHSLLATQVISRVQKTFSIELPLRALFEAPTVAALATQVEAVLRLDQGIEVPALRVVERAGDLPLSFAQQRLWFIDQLESGSATYNIAAAVRLSGVLDAAALERSLSEVVRRHEALRTTFPTVDGLPVQRIAEPHALQLPLVDLSELSEAEREVERLASEEAQQPFDLSVGPLLRAQLLRVSAEEHVVLMTMHHIVSDGWSMGLLVREVAALYEAYRSGQESPLTELPIQYADYAVWQREWLSGEVLEKELSYWREQLAGAPPVLELPTDHVRPPVQTFRGAQRSFVIDASVAEGVKALSRREGATLFMTLLAAFKTLLYRYSGQTSVVVGTPIAGRTQVEVEDLIGFFVNTLVLRTEVSGGLSFIELVRRVKEVALGAYAHQEVPFEKLVEELEPERSLSHTPLFQVMFVMQNEERSGLGMGGLQLSGVQTEQVTAKFDLTLELMETEAGLSGSLEYNTDLYEAETIERMLGHYQTLLRSIVAQPEQRVRELQLLTDSEAEQLLVEWNETEVAYPQQCIHELFEAQAARTPEAVALVFAEARLSYRELNQHANQLGHYLQQLGVGPETLVAVLLERSADLVVGLLAVLKAGGAYVPIDPEYPAERVRYMLADCGARVLLTQTALAAQVESPAGCTVVQLDQEWERIAQQSDVNLASEVTVENLAYVIYTSGSTGAPKGVQIPHRGVVNLLSSFGRRETVATGQTLLAVTSLSFDIAALELFLPLSRGARLLLAARAETGDGNALLEKWQQWDVTVMQATPATWRLLLEAGWRGAADQLVLCGGEALSWELAQRLKVGAGAVWNLYGPTETTVWSSVWEVEAAERVSIGSGIDNTLMYVLDEEQRLVPVGVTGELYIGGAGVARGYLHRPGMTAERFVPDPLSRKAGARLYRTGDQVRLLPDGKIEYLGRGDGQVKIRGFRVELGEIETALMQHERVQQAVVVARAADGGEQRLVAYVVAKAEAAMLTMSEMRQHLGEKLPQYMIPTALVPMTELPLTPNGKVDRRALPEPEMDRGALGVEYAAARTAIEEILVDIWSEVLNVAQVGIHDNFFHLGGHSLLATQVISRARKAFSIELPLRALFEHTSLAALGKHIEVILRTEEGLLMPPLRAVEREGDLPLSFAQQRQWFIEQLEPGLSTYNIAAAVRLSGELDAVALERALSEVVRRHEALRTTFPTVDGLPVQRIAEPGAWQLPFVDLSELPEAERAEAVERLASEEAQRPFDLSVGPLLRAQLLRVSAEEHVVLVTMHHIVSDGWSMGLLVREVSRLYEAYRSGQESPLTELPIQYADYAVWQREWLSGDVLEKELSYWREQLAGAPPVLELPTDHVRPPVQTFRGAQQSFVIDASVAEGVKALSRREGATLFMTLLAAFKTLLYRYSGQTSVVVGTPIAGRTQVEVEELIGFFVNTLVLRTEVSGGISFVDLLQRVKEVALGAYAHQEVPFEKLVEELEPERSLSHTPLFQVMFVMQNEERSGLGMGGLQLSGVQTERVTAKFDLTLQLTETETGLSGSLEYNTDLYEAETIERMLGHYQTLLGSIVTQPEQRVSELQLLTENEAEQLLVEWNETEVAYLPQCIHELFEAQVARTPEAVALVFAEEQVSYEELNRRANQLAHHLRELGVGSETLVAVLLERSVELVVALLGVLKAGGAYVPIDPEYPAERVRYMLADCGARVLLTQAGLVAQVEVPGGCTVVQLDQEWERIAQRSAANVASEVSADNLVYVIYTSGSTGKPKGAMNTHRALCNRLLWMQQAYQLNNTDRVLQKTSVSFDVSGWEFFWPLITGARLVLAQPGGQRDSAYLVQLLTEAQVTTVHFVPSMLEAFLQEQDVERCGHLKRVICSGEALSVELQQRFFERLPVQLENLYGPTEAAIDVSRWSCERDSERRTVPIGRPIANLRLYVLDEEQRLVPVGVTGELYIGGVGVGRGYLGRAALTAERFVPDPFSESGGERLYRTGDQVRIARDGQIEYLGRRDGQVKLRGFRIELGEIEAALLQHEQIHEAVVVARASEGEQRLVAYVVAQEVRSSELRRYLQEKLPHYMVPATFVELERMPLSPNGKVDRRALPEPEVDRAGLGVEYAAPVTAVEEILVNIWSEVLGVPQVGIHDNFFELGGDSILSLRIVAKANQAGVRLITRQIFEHQTIAGLAAVATPTDAIQFGQQRVTGEVLLTPVQHWFFEQQLVNPHHFNQAMMFEFRERIDIALLERALRTLVVHHDALRLRFDQQGHVWQQMNAETEDADLLTVVDVSDLANANRVIEAEATKIQRSLNLSTGPLLKLAVFDGGAEAPTRLLFVIHHLVIDHVSWQILLDDLQSVYGQLTRHEVLQLPSKTTSFQQWSQTLTTYAQSKTLLMELPYWLQEKRVRPLIVDHLNGENLEGSVQTVTVQLGSEETKALLERVPEVFGTRINDALLTALAQSYAQWTGERSLLIDLEGHGREEIFDGVDVSRTVGWFTTVFPVLLKLGEDDRPERAVKAIKEQLRRIPNNGIGYGLLRYLNDDKKSAEQLRTLPQPQVIFNYRGRVENVSPEAFTSEGAQLSTGPVRSPRQQRRYLLEVNGNVSAGQLRFEWNYSANLHNRETVKQWADAFIEALRALIASSASSEAVSYSPSDFPLAKLNQTEIDKLFAGEKGIADVYPLAPLQQGFLFHSLYAPTAGLYFMQIGCVLHDELNLPAFKNAWQEVIARHTALRTEFRWADLAEPLQVVRASAVMPIEELDWRDLSSPKQQEELQSFYESDRVRGFDLTKAPLMRITLIRTADHTFQVVWSHHHLIIDGWSGPLLLRECIALYEALRNGETIQLPQSLPYRNYIEWLQNQDLSQAETFWRRSLKGITKPTSVLGEQTQASSTRQAESFGSQRIQLSEQITRALRAIARKHKLTLNTLTLGAWAFILSEVSGENDVVFGTAVAGRPPELAGAESMVGVFINTLPLRVRLLPEDLLLPWLRTIQEQQLTMQQFAYSPLVKVQEWSEFPRGEALFESFLVFENFWLGDASDRREGSLNISDVRYLGRENYALSIVVGPESELVLKANYNHPQLNARNSMKLLRQLETVLLEIVRQPEITLAELRQRYEKAQGQIQSVQEQELRNAQHQKLKLLKRKRIIGSEVELVSQYEESTT